MTEEEIKAAKKAKSKAKKAALKEAKKGTCKIDNIKFFLKK